VDVDATNSTDTATGVSAGHPLIFAEIGLPSPIEQLQSLGHQQIPALPRFHWKVS
jgi:hypothetical protein